MRIKYLEEQIKLKNSSPLSFLQRSTLWAEVELKLNPKGTKKSPQARRLR